MSNWAFLQSANQSYRDVNRRTLQWMLSRSTTGPWINTKYNPIELRDYTESDGLRGPGYVYGWIQGRALESLVQHGRANREQDPQFAEILLTRSRLLYEALNQLYSEQGHASFCYDQQMVPICTAGSRMGEKQTRDKELFTFSDLFVVKGLIAGSAVHAPDQLERHIKSLQDIIDAMDSQRFLTDESAHLSHDKIQAQRQDFGPRMIALGAASLLHSLELDAVDTFSIRFVQQVLEQHTRAASRLISNVPGGTTLNAGHCIELVGLHLETWGNALPNEQIEQLASLLEDTFLVAFDGNGLRLTVDIANGCYTSGLCPWWSLPETIRASALAWELTENAQYQHIWQRCHDAFFDHFWLDSPPVAVQMLCDDCPADIVPATPDLDPGYHTGLSLLTACDVCKRFSARTNSHY